MTTVKSKFRIEYWMVQITAGIVMLGFGIWLGYCAWERGEYFNFVGLAVCLIFVSLVGSIMGFILWGPPVFLLDDNGIHVSRLHNRKTTDIPYRDIHKFTSRYIPVSSQTGDIGGHYKLEIEFSNDRSMIISENMYSNFAEIKQYMYDKYRELNFEN